MKAGIPIGNGHYKRGASSARLHHLFAVCTYDNASIVLPAHLRIGRAVGAFQSRSQTQEPSVVVLSPYQLCYRAYHAI